MSYEVPRFLATHEIPIEKAVQAPMSLGAQDFSMGKAMERLGKGGEDLVLTGLKIRAAAAKKTRDATDANSKVLANANLAGAELQLAGIKNSLPPEEWEKNRKRLYSEAIEENLKLPMTEETREAVDAVTEARNIMSIDRLAVDIASETVARATTATHTQLITSIVEGGDSEVATAEYEEAATAEFGPEKAAVLVKAALKDGAEQRVKFLRDGVHGEVQAASDSIILDGDGIPVKSAGDPFATAKLMADNPEIPESEQTTLRSTIGTAEAAYQNKIEQGKKDAEKRITSDMLKSFFDGTLTVPTLDGKRHILPTIEYKFMRKGLIEKVPDITDPFAMGKIKRANVQFHSGAISRAKAELIVLENYTKLNKTDRANVIANLEDVEEKIIATAKSNAYGNGKSLMSIEFLGVTSQTIQLFTKGKSEEEKAEINRRFLAETNNRDLYERAIDDRFKELQRKEVTDPAKFSSEALGILLEYQRRKALETDDLVKTVKAEQKRIVEPESTLKPVSEMTKEERLAEYRALTK